MKQKGKIFELFKSSAPFYISKISESDFSLWDNYVNLIRSKDDKGLDLLAERLAYLMAEHNPFDYFMYLHQILPKKVAIFRVPPILRKNEPSSFNIK